jgi:hypothetical protein
MIFLLWLLLVTQVGAAELSDHTLPNLRLTPGVSTGMSVREICATLWGRDVRHVTPDMESEVFRRYGLTGNNDRSDGCGPDMDGRHHEVDHLISREIGGADDVNNLWPQCYSGQWSAVVKDRLENRLHKEVCAGRLTLDEAQKMIRADWISAYKRFFGNSP